MFKRLLNHIFRQLLLVVLKAILIVGAIVVQSVRTTMAWIRNPESFRAFFSRIRIRPGNMWIYGGAAIGILLLPLALIPLEEAPPAAEAQYFASDLIIPEESLPYVGDDSLFREALVAMGHRLDMNPSWILAVMFHESRLNPAALNHRGSGATGLIQFMGPALQDINRRLGTRYYLSDVRNMDAINQLRLVEAYYSMVQERYGPIRNFTDAYLAVLFPKSMGQHPDHVLFARPSRRYLQNSGLDMDKDGRVTVGDISTRLFRMFPDLSEVGIAGEAS